MSGAVIKVENLYKEYRLGTISHGTLYRDLQSWWAKMRGREDPNSVISTVPSPDSRNPGNPHFLALRDVSFEVRRGEVLGIIGRNGAGKSTLLKILSEVTSPTRGTVKIKGRIASLLEVGTGFHPELTGRENIYLNGAILGMTKKETTKKFDEIVDFAEVEKFIDTPVKRYSSGMYVRLAFAVAAHLEPEILIVDEVLAVGDAQFQKKCLGKMGEVARGGRTVLFVSHNMEAVLTLCTEGIILISGEIARHGDIRAVVKHYNESLAAGSYSIEGASRGGAGGVHITKVWLDNAVRRKAETFSASEKVFLNLEAEVAPHYRDGKRISVGFAIDTFEGRRLFTIDSSWVNAEIVTRGNRLAVSGMLSCLPFVPGRYLVSASVIHRMETLDCVIHCAAFEIMEETSHFIHRNMEQGVVNIPCRFDTTDV